MIIRNVLFWWRLRLKETITCKGKDLTEHFVLFTQFFFETKIALTKSFKNFVVERRDLGDADKTH